MKGMNHGGMENMSMDLDPTNENFDLRFIDAMIPHHEGAITMIKEVFNKSKRPEVRQLAQNIMTSEQAEVK